MIKVFSSPIAARLVLALVLAAWVGAFFKVSSSVLYPGDDYLYLMFCGLEIRDPATSSLQHGLVDRLKALNADDFVIFRAQLRSEYCSNYPIPSLSMTWMGDLLQRGGVIDPARDLPRYLGYATHYGLLVSAALIGLLLWSCLLALREPRVATAFTLALVAALAVAVFWPLSSLGWIFVQDTPSPPSPERTVTTILLAVWRTLLNPGPAYSLVGPTPRSTAAVAGAVIFALRWSGRPDLGYWLLLPVSLIHQSMAPILLVLLLGCDLCARPANLKRAAVLIPVGVNLALIFVRERMADIIGVRAPALAVIALLVLVGTVVFVPVVRAMLVTPLLRRLARLQEATFGGLPQPTAEALLLVAALFVTVPLLYALVVDDMTYRVISIWSELPLRLAGMMQVPVFAGLAFTAMRAFDSRVASGRTAAGTVALAAAALGAVALLWVSRPSTITPVSAKVAFAQNASLEIDAAERYTLESRPTIYHEHRWYYVIMEAALTGQSRMDRMFGNAMPPR